MNDSRFTMYSLFTSLMWGSLTFVAISDIDAAPWFLPLFIFLILITGVIHEGRESSSKRLKAPLTSKYFISLFVGILAIVLLVFVIDEIRSLLDNKTFMSIGFMFIGAAWTYQIQSAWYKNKKYNKSLKTDAAQKTRNAS